MVSRSTLIENLKLADMLKEKSLSCQNINNMDIWTHQRKLLNIYEELLIEDLEYALDKKVEQDLWNYCFKNYIAYLQSFSKDNKGNAVSGHNNAALIQAKLSWFLECASGFYLSFLQQICTLFSVDLPFKRCDKIFGVIEDNESFDRRNSINIPKKTSCYYICQYCLVHLGDIARYRNQTIQAQSFYKQAVGVGPWSGQPYNQLALLGACLPDRLSTVFYYVRSLAVAHPFHNALTNLTYTLSKCINYKNEDIADGKITSNQYESLFLKLVACLHCNKELSQVQTILSTLGPALTPLIATQQFTPWKLIEICVISIWIWEGECIGKEGNASTLSSGIVNNTNSACTNGTTPSTSPSFCASIGKEVMSEYLSGFLTSLLLPLYTMSSDTLLSYFALSPIKALLCWMECSPGCISKISKPSLWRGICKLLNDLRVANPTPSPHFINDALPEDYDLRGFLPFDQVLQHFNYQGDDMNNCIERKLRAFRLIKQGEWLSSLAQSKPIYIKDGVFEAVSVTPAESPLSISSDIVTLPIPQAIKKSQPALQPKHGIHSSIGSSGDRDAGTSSNSSGGIKAKSHRHNVALQSIQRLANQSGEAGVWQGKSYANQEQSQIHSNTSISPSSALSSDPRWWPPPPQIPGNAEEEVANWTGSSGLSPSDSTSNQEGRMYSLFSGGDNQAIPTSNLTPSILKHQSLWSGPGPSPLERLLQQQKNQRSNLPPQT